MVSRRLHYAARSRSIQGSERRIWAYSCEQDDGTIVPVGYCCGLGAWNEDLERAKFGIYYDIAFDSYKAKLRFKDRYHEDGHASREEAEECYRQHLLDQHLTLQCLPRSEKPQPCDVPGCDTPTHLWAVMPPASQGFSLCEHHHNRAGAEKAFPSDALTAIIASY